MVFHDGVYTLTQAPEAPKIKGLSPEESVPFGPNPWWYQGKLENYLADASNATVSNSASAVSNKPSGDSRPTYRPHIHVKVDGNRVTIDLPVQFKGSGLTPERQATIIEGIEKAWSGTFGPYEVTTTVSIPPPNTPADDINTVTVLDEQNQSTVNPATHEATIYTSERGEQPYSDAQLRFVAAHEAGHLMGEDDHYTMTVDHGFANHISDPGYEHNVMGERNGTVDWRNIAGIIERARAG